MVNKEYLDKYLQGIIEEHKIAGMSVAVTDKQGVVSFDFCVDISSAALWNQCNVLCKGGPDVCQVFKEVQMVFFYI